MPIEASEIGQPPATQRVEYDAGPHEVSLDLSAESTGYLEHNPGDETVEVTHHTDEPVIQFDEMKPYTVALEGFPTPRSFDPDSAKVQTKVVTAPAKDAPASTEGAETK